MLRVPSRNGRWPSPHRYCRGSYFRILPFHLRMYDFLSFSSLLLYPLLPLPSPPSIFNTTDILLSVWSHVHLWRVRGHKRLQVRRRIWWHWLLCRCVTSLLFSSFLFLFFLLSLSLPLLSSPSLMVGFSARVQWGAYSCGEPVWSLHGYHCLLQIREYLISSIVFSNLLLMPIYLPCIVMFCNLNDIKPLVYCKNEWNVMEWWVQWFGKVVQGVLVTRVWFDSPIF